MALCALMVNSECSLFHEILRGKIKTVRIRVYTYVYACTFTFSLLNISSKHIHLSFHRVSNAQLIRCVISNLITPFHTNLKLL